MFCDFHCHIDEYGEKEFFDFVKMINENRIVTLASSCDVKSYKLTLERAKKSRFIFASFGIHPWKAQAESELEAKTDEKEIDSCLESSPVIGEIGLDYVWGKACKAAQQKVFEKMLSHCDLKKKYCVIHTKGAEKRVLETLCDFPGAKPVIHWYHGPEKYFRVILDRNYFCTFGVELSRSRYIQKLFRMTPDELILAETDNPSSEQWLGGTRRDPLLICDVVKNMARLKKIDFEKMNALILKNSLRVLNESGLFSPT